METRTITTVTIMDRTETVITVEVYRTVVVQNVEPGEKIVTIIVRTTAIETVGMQDTINAAKKPTIIVTIIKVTQTAADLHRVDT